MQVLSSGISHPRLPKILFTILIVFLFSSARDVAGQTEVQVSVVSLVPARVRVVLIGEPTRSWSFRNTYGRIVGLGNRMDNMEGVDSGEKKTVRRVAPGEYRSDEGITTLSYEVDLTPPIRPSDLSHVSWLTGDTGLLKLGDLLPQQTLTESVDLVLNLPPAWTSASSASSVQTNRYRFPNADHAIVAIGKSLRQSSSRIGGRKVAVITAGKWSFQDKEVARVVAELISEYEGIVRQPLAGDSALILFPLSGGQGPGVWTAETRGSTTALLMGATGKRSAMLARLKVVLAHELLHLWVPNALALEGDYDWFFEGFTLYQALLTALKLKYIKFADYLDTMARVYDSYRSHPEGAKLSLLEASERRWTTTSSVVYDKGMLTAFIYDLMQRREKRAGVPGLYRELFLAAEPKGRDANEVLRTLLDNVQDGFFAEFVESSKVLDLPKLLGPFGLEVELKGSVSRITVGKQIAADQRSVLKSLGY